MITQDFNNDFNFLAERIFDKKIPTVFARYADGELGVMLGKKVLGIDQWTAPAYKTKLGKDLGNTLKNNSEEWFYGISCSCCDPTAKHILLENLKLTGVSMHNITYSNLWVNSNYYKFIKKIEQIDEDVIVIANKIGFDKKYPFNVVKYFSVEDDCVMFWENNKEEFLSKLLEFKNINNTLFFVSAGPMSEVILDFLWKQNNTNRYIDVGSSLDKYTKGIATRSYMIENQPYYNQKCVF